MERGIMFAHRAILEHEVLQRVMQTEPEKLLPALTVESNRIREGIADVPGALSRAAGRGRGGRSRRRPPTSSPGWSSPTCRAPGRWDLDDPAQVARLVRSELLAGVVVPSPEGAVGAAPLERSLTMRQIPT